MNPDLGGKLTGAVIGAAIAVHRELGPGLEEPVYERAFRAELLAQGIPCLCQRPLPLVYKKIKLDCGYRVDVIVDRKLIVELKSVEMILPVHEAQLLTYLRLTGIELGLVLNFDVAVLKDGIRRRALSLAHQPAATTDQETEITDSLTGKVLHAAVEVHRHLGPGLLRSAYETALCYELANRRIPFERNKFISLQYRDLRFDNVADVTLLVNCELPLMCLSRDAISDTDCARLLARLRQGNWRNGLILNFNTYQLRDGIRRLAN
jgi:GxxExxY protein